MTRQFERIPKEELADKAKNQNLYTRVNPVIEKLEQQQKKVKRIAKISGLSGVGIAIVGGGSYLGYKRTRRTPKEN